MNRALLAGLVVSLALFAPAASANPITACLTFVYDNAGGLFGPQLSMGESTITLLIGTSAGDAGAVAGVVIDPVACGAGADPLNTVVTQAGGAGSGPNTPSTPDVPVAPLLS